MDGFILPVTILSIQQNSSQTLRVKAQNEHMIYEVSNLLGQD